MCSIILYFLFGFIYAPLVSSIRLQIYTLGSQSGLHSESLGAFKTKQGPKARRQKLWGTSHCTFGAREQSCGGWLCRRASGSPHGPLSQIREMCSRGPTQDFQIRPGAMGRCPPIFGWGLGPAHGSPVKENPSGELEVRTGGLRGACIHSLTSF